MALKQLLNILHQSHRYWKQRILSEFAAVELKRLRNQADDDARMIRISAILYLSSGRE